MVRTFFLLFVVVFFLTGCGSELTKLKEEHKKLKEEESARKAEEKLKPQLDSAKAEVAKANADLAEIKRKAKEDEIKKAAYELGKNEVKDRETAVQKREDAVKDREITVQKREDAVKLREEVAGKLPKDKPPVVDLPKKKDDPKKVDVITSSYDLAGHLLVEKQREFAKTARDGVKDAKKLLERLKEVNRLLENPPADYRLSEPVKRYPKDQWGNYTEAVKQQRAIDEASYKKKRDKASVWRKDLEDEKSALKTQIEDQGFELFWNLRHKEVDVRFAQKAVRK